jgi:hypothetical protein
MARPGKGQREVWVIYHLLSGYVRAVYFRMPPERVFDPRVYGTLQTRLGESEVGKAHQLRVNGGKVVHVPSLAGI